MPKHQADSALMPAPHGFQRTKCCQRSYAIDIASLDLPCSLHMFIASTARFMVGVQPCIAFCQV